jgi:hypothetical protein
VYNQINVTGEESDIAKFVEAIKHKPFLSNEENWIEGKSFSFHSFVTEDISYEEYHEVNGTGPNGSTGQGRNNWYNWNTRNWDTKWDACDVDLNIDPKSIHLTFNTAWAPPEPVFQAICTMFPEININFWWEEEQGFGAKGYNEDGAYTVSSNWDIPDSHQDYIDKGDEESCNCHQTDDEEDWFDDCPGKTMANFVVTVSRTYEVFAYTNTTLEEIKSHIESEESGYELPHNVTVKAHETVVYKIDSTNIKEN